LGEARFLLERESENTPPAKDLPYRVLLWSVAALLFIALGVLSFVYFRQPLLSGRLLRYAVSAPENTTLLRSFAVSPDGRVFVLAAQVNGKQQLWSRALDAFQTQPMAGTNVRELWLVQ
jgi:hypothetical protein